MTPNAGARHSYTSWQSLLKVVVRSFTADKDKQGMLRYLIKTISPDTIMAAVQIVHEERNKETPFSSRDNSNEDVDWDQRFDYGLQRIASSGTPELMLDLIKRFPTLSVGLFGCTTGLGNVFILEQLCYSIHAHVTMCNNVNYCIQVGNVERQHQGLRGANQ